MTDISIGDSLVCAETGKAFIAAFDGCSELLLLAQDIANKTGTPRYVKWTSLGWRIEIDPALFPDCLTVTVTPKPA